MCLAIPAQLVELRPDDQAVVDLGGIRKEISIALVADVQVGDYVIVHVGHAIGVIDPQEAQRTLAMFAEMSALTSDPMPWEEPSAGSRSPGQAHSQNSDPHAVGTVGAEVSS